MSMVKYLKYKSLGLTNYFDIYIYCIRDIGVRDTELKFNCIYRNCNINISKSY